ncbi:MAG: sulfotransferase family 2 domain-containing protein [Marinicellaceae bacterium]
MNLSPIRKDISNKAKQWHKNNCDKNTQLNVSWLEDHVLQLSEMTLIDCLWIFSNIPKTAGTALEKYLIQAFEMKDIFSINADELINLPESIYLKSRYPQFISGYHCMHDMLFQLLGDRKIVHLSMMRNPIERVVSCYNQVITQDYNLQNVTSKVTNFDDFINDSMQNVANGQAKRFAGVSLTENAFSDKEVYFKAKYNIDHCFTLVGVTEFFSQFHKLIAKRCAVTFHDLPPITRLETKVQMANLSPDQMKIIKKKNKIDIQLYQYVRSKFLNIINS